MRSPDLLGDERAGEDAPGILHEDLEQRILTAREVDGLAVDLDPATQSSSGVSSSAALELAFGVTWNFLARLALDNRELAKLGQIRKADRGYALSEDRPLAARHFKAPALTRRMTAGEAFPRGMPTTQAFAAGRNRVALAVVVVLGVLRDGMPC